MTAVIDRPDASAHAETDIDIDIAAMEWPIDYASGALGDEPTPSERGGSKWNALQHGLMAKSLFPADLAAEIKKHTAVLTDQFRPTTPYEVGLIAVMGRSGAQCERCRNLRVVDLQRTMDRAVLCWDSDRCASIKQLVARLTRDPERIASIVGWTKQGADWMHATWHGLSEVLATNGGWNEDQRRLAFDLLGVRPELRDGSLKVPDGDDAPALVALVRAEVGRLEGRQERSLRALDRCEREMAAVGMPGVEDAATKRLRKYEASARREYQTAKSELLRSRAEVAAAAGPPPTPSPAPATSPPTPPAHTDPPPMPRPTTSSEDTEAEMRTEARMKPAAEEPAVAQTAAAAEPAAEPAPVSQPAAPVAEPAGLAPRTVNVASNVSRSAVGPDRRDRQRRLRRAQEKQDRKAARHHGR